MWHDWLFLIVSVSLQYRVHRDTVKRPHEVEDLMSEGEYRKARVYRLDKHRFSFVYSIYSQLELMVCRISFSNS